MDGSRWHELVDQLRGPKRLFGFLRGISPLNRVEFDDGLTDSEVTMVEGRFSFRFPPDLREFLQTALPFGPDFPDWRSGKEARLREWLDLPRRGVLFDIEQNEFWLEVWGPRPESVQEAMQVASELIANAPRLIPIFAHRMMPDEPHIPGNPVFSVHQTDIIYYGFDLDDYLRHEFKLPGRKPWPERVRPIRFWDLDKFQDVRWGPNGNSFFDDSDGKPRATI